MRNRRPFYGGEDVNVFVIGFDWISRIAIAALVVEEQNPTQPTVTFFNVNLNEAIENLAIRLLRYRS